MAEKWDMRKAMGLGESKGVRIWVIVATLLGLAANVVVLVACVAPLTKPLYLYRVDRSRLAEALADLTDTRLSDLNDTSLPDYWYWGLSGICSVWEDDSSVACVQKFPPVFSVPEMVEIAFESNEEDDKNKTGAVLEHWEGAYLDLESGPRNKAEAEFVDMLKAAGALSILSAIMAFALLAVSIVALGEGWRKKPNVWMLYFVSIVDGALLLGSAVLLVLAMNRGPRYVLEEANVRAELVGDFVGPGMYVAFAGAVIKIGVMGFAVALVLVVNLIGSLRALRNASKERDEDNFEYAY